MESKSFRIITMFTKSERSLLECRCHFSNHDKTMLIGADPKHVDDRCIRVTIHHCFFDGTKQRHPRVRFGKVHIYNNYTRGWRVYAVCASVESQVTNSSSFYTHFWKCCETGMSTWVLHNL